MGLNTYLIQKRSYFFEFWLNPVILSGILTIFWSTLTCISYLVSLRMARSFYMFTCSVLWIVGPCSQFGCEKNSTSWRKEKQLVTNLGLNAHARFIMNGFLNTPCCKIPPPSPPPSQKNKIRRGSTVGIQIHDIFLLYFTFNTVKP